MGWAENLTGGGGQQDPGRGSRLGTPLRDIRGEQASGEGLRGRIRSHTSGDGPEIWELLEILSLVSQFIILLSFTVIGQGAVRKIQESVGSSLGGKEWEVLERPSTPRPVWKWEVPQRPQVTSQNPGLVPAFARPPEAAAWLWVCFFPLDCELRVRQKVRKVQHVHSEPSAHLSMKKEKASEGGDSYNYWRGTEWPFVLI